MAGIYLHIPFCKQACTYCNFHFSTTFHLRKALLSALEREIFLTAKTIAIVPPIETIYFGGGTPSLLLPAEVESILNTIKQLYPVSELAELTLEANPDDVTEVNLFTWKNMGINRFSLGVQSFNEAELKWMNRAHNASESMQSIEAIIAAGFQNFSIDLIYGSPLLSNEDFRRNVEIVTHKNIPHLSAYALTVEPKTALNALIKSGKYKAVDEVRQAEQFDILVSMMTNAGYEQYEISNFAKPGFRSKHNSSYWQGKPYFGFGPSAHSYDGENKRRWNVANNAMYIKSIEQDLIPYEEETLTTTQQLNERIMIGLRTIEGIQLNEITRKYGEEYSASIVTKAGKYLEVNKLKFKNSNLILTEQGKFFADGIAADLFF